MGIFVNGENGVGVRVGEDWRRYFPWERRKFINHGESTSRRCGHAFEGVWISGELGWALQASDRLVEIEERAGDARVGGEFGDWGVFWEGGLADF